MGGGCKGGRGGSAVAVGLACRPWGRCFVCVRVRAPVCARAYCICAWFCSWAGWLCVCLRVGGVQGKVQPVPEAEEGTAGGSSCALYPISDINTHVCLGFIDTRACILACKTHTHTHTG